MTQVKRAKSHLLSENATWLPNVACRARYTDILLKEGTGVGVTLKKH